MHHSTFVTRIFADIVKEFGLRDYEYSIYETKTRDILEKVSSTKSDLGILYISSYNQDYYEKTFKELNLTFKILAEYDVYAYVGKNHPLASRDEIELSELETYPCLIFDQDENSSFYFYEEIISTYEYKNIIRTCDRATTIDLMQELDGYSIGIGTVSTEKLSAIKIKADEKIYVGYLVRKDRYMSDIAKRFIELLEINLK